MVIHQPITHDYAALEAAFKARAESKREFVRTRAHYGERLLARFRDEANELDALAWECGFAMHGDADSIEMLNGYLEDDESGIARAAGSYLPGSVAA